MQNIEFATFFKELNSATVDDNETFVCVLQLRLIAASPIFKNNNLSIST